MSLIPLRSCLSATIASGALCLLAVVTVSPTNAQTSPAQPPDRTHIEDVLRGLNRGRGFGQVAISPDGKRLAWIEGGRGGGEILVASPADLSKTERVTAAGKPDQHCREGEIAWEPDSMGLAFFSDCADPGKQADLYLSRLDGSPVKRLTAMNGIAQAPAFSPDGNQIAFLYVEGATRPAGALAAMKPPSGVIGEDGVEVQRVAVAQRTRDCGSARAGDAGRSARLRVRLGAGLERPGVHRRRSAGREQLVGGKALHPDARMREPKAILAPAEVSGPLHGLQIAVPRWSPDGKDHRLHRRADERPGIDRRRCMDRRPRMAASRGDLTAGPTHIARVDRMGRQRAYSLSANSPAATASSIRSVCRATGSARAVPISFGVAHLQHSRQRRRRPPGDEPLRRPRPFALRLRASTFDHPTEIYGAKPGTVMTAGLDGVMQLTHLNDGVKPAWGKAVSLSWKSDSFHVQGWLLLPKDYDPAKKYPLIVEVHGGPAAAVMSRWGGGGGLSADRLLGAGLLRAAAQSARQLRPGRGVHPGQPQGLRLRRPARHPRRRRRGRGQVSQSTPTASASPAGATAAS